MRLQAGNQRGSASFPNNWLCLWLPFLFARARRWITLGASPPYEKVAAPSEYNKKEPAKLAIVPLLRFRHCKHEIYCVLSLAKWYFLTSQKEGSRRCNFYTQWHERTTSQQLHFQREQNTLRMCKKSKVAAAPATPFLGSENKCFPWGCLYLWAFMLNS